MKTIYVCILFIYAHFMPAFAQSNSGDGLIGTWMVQDASAKVKIEKVQAKFSGKIIWLKNPIEKNGTPKLDIKNPEKILQSRPIMGLSLLHDFKYEGDNIWSDGFTIPIAVKLIVVK